MEILWLLMRRCAENLSIFIENRFQNLNFLIFWDSRGKCKISNWRLFSYPISILRPVLCMIFCTEYFSNIMDGFGCHHHKHVTEPQTSASHLAFSLLLFQSLSSTSYYTIYKNINGDSLASNAQVRGKSIKFHWKSFSESQFSNFFEIPWKNLKSQIEDHFPIQFQFWDQFYAWFFALNILATWSTSSLYKGRGGVRSTLLSHRVHRVFDASSLYVVELNVSGYI